MLLGRTPNQALVDQSSNHIKGVRPVTVPENGTNEEVETSVPMLKKVRK